MSEIRVDAYTATVEDKRSEALEWVVSAVPCREQILVGREGKINLWKYEHGVAVFDGKTCVAAVRWGGNGGAVSIELKGSVADDVYEALRDRYPGHACSRADAAVDRTRPGLFEQAHVAMMAIAMETNPRVSSEPAGKGWDQPGLYGRTKYFGTRGSDQHGQLYEKGFERRDRGGMSADLVDLNHVRWEASIHPSKKSDKLALAICTPLQMVGWNGWMRDMFESFTGIEADLVLKAPRLRDDERTYAALLHQYGGFLDRLAEVEGDALLRRIVNDHRELQKLKAGRFRAS